jgi:hypothetical protein
MTLAEIIEQLEACGYECEAGPLENNVAWQELKEIAQHETDCDCDADDCVDGLCACRTN